VTLDWFTRYFQLFCLYTLLRKLLLLVSQSCCCTTRWHLIATLSAAYMDVVITRLRQCGLGYKLVDCFYGCWVYADYIPLLAHSVKGMQEMLRMCDEFALDFNMKFNGTKSVAIRSGYRSNMQCSLFILSGNYLKYVSSVKYLGVYFVAAKCFKISVDHLGIGFCQVLTIFSRVKAPNSELVVHLRRSYCLSFLLCFRSCTTLK